ncbi:adenosylcobinamide-GDP ribazoletransferase [Ruixingdingia sedimenti]|uniref:Adenosylcobinamide-GDP ribazoletransferase n=1 Tax=Ruixingdingia sedimenti TaxID=3073604 RepID=A0ABU1F8B7_9RHOB|nr:adenosylcobinamide-GDP ribazoletransferase [Xinfangfangia sp. LG-4]MDR5652858.1 adenosylcobinamide-GDP ribazoletransferase [Xinfangfangia sp. LG-4]
MADPLAHLRLALMVLTRLPAGRLAAPPPLGAAAWAFPVAGAIAALIPAGVFALAFAALPPLLAALLALAAGMAITGALHEDGLADLADGFGGGRTRERKLEIMRDSRIGSYGVLALILSVGLRAGALAAAPDAGAGALALVAVGTASRAPLAAVMAALPPARAEGLAAAAGAPSVPVWALSVALGLGALLALPAPGLSLAALALAVLAMAWLTRRQIGGHTGDSLGATQQAGEVALWLVLAGGWA